MDEVAVHLWVWLENTFELLSSNDMLSLMCTSSSVFMHTFPKLFTCLADKLYKIPYETTLETSLLFFMARAKPAALNQLQMPTEELNKVLLAEVRKGRQDNIECLVSLGAIISILFKERTKNMVTGVPVTRCYTFLHVAAQRGDVGMLDTLLLYGADPHVGTKDLTVVANSDLSGGDGRLPLDIAAKEGHVEIVKALVKWEEEGNVMNYAKEEGGMECENASPSPTQPPPPPPLFPPSFVDSIMRLGKKVDEHRTLLFAWIEEGGTFELLQDLLKMGEMLDAVQSGGLQPLHYAVKLGKADAVRELYRLGAQMEPCRDNLNTCYHIAVDMGCVDALKVVAEHDPAMNEPNQLGDLPLHVAARKGNVEVMKVLIKCGGHMALDRKGYGGVTPLHCAAKLGHLEVVRELVERGAEVNDATLAGETPLILSTDQNHTSTSLYLIELVKSFNHKARVILGRIDSHGFTPLHHAARNGNIELVRALVENKVALDTQSNNWYTPLLLAASGGHTEVVKFLLEHNASIEVKTLFHQRTPLMEAVIGEKVETVALLLEKGAKVDIQDCATTSPLYYAVRKGNMAITRMLLEKGAPPNEDDGTPLAVAVDHGVEMIRLLLQFKAKPTSKALVMAIEKKRGAEALVLLEEGGASCYVEDYTTTPGLMLAMCHELTPVAKKLVEKGAPVTPEILHFAVHTGVVPMVEMILEHVRVDLLADAKGVSTYGMTLPSEFRSLDKCRCNACTSLHCASDLGNLRITQMLVGKGFNVNTKNSKGETSLHSAIRMRRVEVAQYLIEQGAKLDVVDSLGMTPLLCALLPHHQPTSTQSQPLHHPPPPSERPNGATDYVAKQDTLFLSPPTLSPPPPPPSPSLSSIIKQLIDRGVSLDTKASIAYPLPHAPPLLFPVPPVFNQLPPSSLACVYVPPATFNGTPLEHMLWNRWASCKTMDMDWEGLWELLGGNEGHRGAGKGDRTEKGDTLLHQAVLMVDTKVVEMLVKGGFDVNAVNSDGKTPLALGMDFIVRCKGGNYLIDMVTQEEEKIQSILTKQPHAITHSEWPSLIFKNSLPSTPHVDVATVVANRPKVTVRRRKIE